MSVVEFVSEAVREEETLRERVHMPGEGCSGQETEDRRQDVDDQEDHVGPLQAHVRRPGHFLHPPGCWADHSFSGVAGLSIGFYSEEF